MASESLATQNGTVATGRAPFVGREDLLHHFHELASRAWHGHALVVALTGEAGIGKTRLLQAFAERGISLGLDIVRADGSALPTDAPDHVAHGGVPTGLTVVRPTLECGSTALRPRLVVVDDAARPERLPDLASLSTSGAGEMGDLVILALSPGIGTALPEVRRSLAALARQHILLQIAVPPLGEPELSELTRHLLGDRPDARLQETISSLSEGNPFLAEELVLDLLRRGLVARNGGTWYLLGDLPPMYVPATVATTLTHELGELDAPVFQTLASAAVLGAGFQFDVLDAATVKPSEQLLQHLEAGVEHGILRDATEPPDDFQFTHELVRRMLYRGLSGVRRRRLHQSVAEALEGRLADADGADQSPTLAYHFTRGVDRTHALAYTLRALGLAERLCNWDEAIRYCREALDLVRQVEAAGATLQVDLLERLAALYFGRVQTFAAGVCWREALRLCETPSVSPLRRAALAARLAALGPTWYSIDAAESGLEQVLQSSPVSPEDVRWLFDAYLELGLANQRLGRLGAALRYLHAARDVVDPTDRARNALAQYSLGGLLTSAGRPAEAVVLVRSALDVLDDGLPDAWSHTDPVVHLRDPRRDRCLALGELARALVHLDRAEEALRVAERARVEEARFGILGGRGYRAIAQVELHHGRPEAALQVLVPRSRDTAAGSLSVHRTADLVLISRAHLARGDIEQALESAAEGVAICMRSGAREHLAGLHLATAHAHHAWGEEGTALETLATTHRVIDDTGTEVYRADAKALEAEIRGATDRSDSTDRGRPVRAAFVEPMEPPESSAHRRDAVNGRTRDTACASAQSASDGSRPLTVREREVLTLMADGQTNRQMADHLVLSDKTVKRHVSNIFDKLTVSTRAAAVRRGFEIGLL